MLWKNKHIFFVMKILFTKTSMTTSDHQELKLTKEVKNNVFILVAEKNH